MSYAKQMSESNPSQAPVDTDTLVECIEACFDCIQSCTACADASLGEEDIHMMVRCIRLDLDCADICTATGKMLSRQTAFEAALAESTLRTCVVSCRVCAEECERHAEHMEHCRINAEACRRCESACNILLSVLSPQG